MGFHICVVGYLFGIPALLICEAHLMIYFFVSSTLAILPHVKPVNAAVSRAPSSRLK